MSALGDFVYGFFKALFGWGQTQAEKPKVITDANTPKSVRDKYDAARDEWLRNKKRGSN